ncbi:MAG TPA: hypothetical protein VK530_08300 [Candidatus Acidoferrum sp.]|nr:hypothetical protein [Candidatus Acidoferrum sp.]
MNPRWRAAIVILGLVLLAGVFLAFFQPAAAMMEVAARELRYFWWIILLVALAVWLIWGVGRKPK